jgi:hypothetical protein
MQNAEVGVSKDTYFEMCEMLGDEPNEEDIPLEITDFPELVQQSFIIYRLLPDVWDTMNGGYLGKDYTIVFNLFTMYELENYEIPVAFGFLQNIDQIRSKSIAEKIKARSPAT